MPGSPVGVIFQGANSSPPICSVNKWMVSSSQRGDRKIYKVKYTKRVLFYVFAVRIMHLFKEEDRCAVLTCTGVEQIQLKIRLTQNM